MEVFHVHRQRFAGPHARRIHKLEDGPVSNIEPSVFGQKIEKMEHLIDGVELREMLLDLRALYNKAVFWSM